MVTVVFVSSGSSHATKSEERSKSIGMSKGFTVFLGVAELAGGLGRGFFCAYSIGWAGIDSDHGGRHLQENLHVAYRFPGRENLRLAP